jgi:type III pantothenate kinase
VILCLDCGNSRLKWGLRDLPDGREWIASGVLAHTEIAQLARQLPVGCVPRTIVGCNVAGPECARGIEVALKEVFKVQVNWITSLAAQCGVANGYDNPASLGADRWAALIGARALHRGATLVVLAGTATTIDVLDADGKHQGGLILPGLSMMANALTAGTARLPIAQGQFRQLPRNTHDAITSGAIQATLGAIQRMFAMLQSDHDAICLLAGGAADSLQTQLALPYRRADKLVLEGLACIGTAQCADTA